MHITELVSDQWAYFTVAWGTLTTTAFFFFFLIPVLIGVKRDDWGYSKVCIVLTLSGS